MIIVRDHFEENPKKLGNVNLVDPSSGITFEGNINNSLIQNYRNKVKKNDHQFYTDLQQNGIKFIKIYTNEDPIGKIAGLLNK